MEKHENEKLYWEEYWKKEDRSETTFLFSDILKKCGIGISNYFEFGCAPGSIMSYISETYNAKVSGLDLVDKSIIEQFLKQHQIDNYELFEGDIETFQTDQKFDFVGSYGFIEHFDNPNFVIDQHKSLVDINGYLCITVPNMRYINYLFNLVFSKELLKFHNLSIMDLKVLKDLILDDEFEEIYASYYLTSMFQANRNSQRLKEHTFLDKIYKIINKVMDLLNLSDIPNKYASPYIIVIAKRVDKTKVIDNIKK